MTTEDIPRPAELRRYSETEDEQARSAADANLSRALHIARHLMSSRVGTRDLVDELARKSENLSSQGLAAALSRDLMRVRDRDLVHACDLALELSEAREDDLVRSLAGELAENVGRMRTRHKRPGASESESGDIVPDTAPMGDRYYELIDRVATAVYVLARTELDKGESLRPDESAQEQLSPEHVQIAQLAIVSSFDDDPECFRRLMFEVEQLLQALTFVAHEPMTSRMLSERATNHEGDGRHLLFGTPEKPRDHPPEPSTVYGWITGAARILQEAHPATGEVVQFLSTLGSTATTEPGGLQKGMQDITETPYFRKALERAKAGTLDGLEEGARNLIAHPMRSSAAAAGLAATIYNMASGWPWIQPIWRALVQLVRAV